MSNLIKHFNTITKHRHKVILHCFKCGIGFQGLFHDLTKYSLAEFVPGVRYYQGNRSPNEKEREELGYSLAWMHHKGRNRHHFEYWNDFDIKTKLYMPVKMPLRFVKEMFCDRIAASKIYKAEKYKNSDPLEYFTVGNAASKMHPETAALLKSWLLMLSESGEKETFTYLRSLSNHNEY